MEVTCRDIYSRDVMAKNCLIQVEILSPKCINLIFYIVCHTGPTKIVLAMMKLAAMLTHDIHIKEVVP